MLAGLAKRPNIADRMRAMTPEQKAEFYRSRSEKMKLKRQALEAKALEKKQRALAFVVEDEMNRAVADTTNYDPSPEFINALEAKIRFGQDINSIRTRLFPDIPQKAWEKVMHSLRMQLTPSSDHQGVVVEGAKFEKLKILKKRLVQAKRMAAETKAERVKQGYIKDVWKIEDDIASLRLEIAKTHRYIGTVEDKTKTSMAIHVHTTVQRPSAPVQKDVTPAKVVEVLPSGD